MNITITNNNWVSISPKVRSAHLKELTFDLWFHSGQEKRSPEWKPQKQQIQQNTFSSFLLFLFLYLSLTDRAGRAVTVHTGCGWGGGGVKICYKSREIQVNCVSLLGRSGELTPCVSDKTPGPSEEMRSFNISLVHRNAHSQHSFVKEGCKVLAGQLQLLSWRNGK